MKDEAPTTLCDKLQAALREKMIAATQKPKGDQPMGGNEFARMISSNAQQGTAGVTFDGKDYSVEDIMGVCAPHSALPKLEMSPLK